MTTLDDAGPADFYICLADGSEETYKSTDKIQYQWATGPDGTLFIYRKVINTMFGVTTNDARIAAYSPNSWWSVQVEVEEEEEGPQLEVVGEEYVISDEEAQATLDACLADAEG